MIGDVLRQMSYGMFLVTAQKEGALNGQVANTVVQVSNDPPTVALSIHRDNLTHRYIEASREALVMILHEDTPLSVIQRFGFHSGRDTAKFEGLSFERTERGFPYLREHALGYLELCITQQVDCGTHSLFVGEVVEAKVLRKGTPLTYHHYHQVKQGAVSTAAPIPSDEDPEKRNQYICGLCGYTYDAVMGDAPSQVSPGTEFADLPVTWICPLCGAGKDRFERRS